jgi:two-component system sensor histidine kinase PilS (NtrC family)
LGAVRKLNQSMVDNLPIGLLMVDNQGRILRSNPTAGSILKEDHLDKKNIFTVFPTAKDLFLSAFHMNGSLNKDLPFTRSSENLILRTQIIPQTEGFEKNHLVVIEDLTRIRQMELAVRQSEKLAAVGQLAAGIAHEIRNPLTGISGSIELLSQGSETEEDKKLKKIIMKEIDRLNNLITEFLDYSKPEKVPVEPVNISKLIDDILKSEVYKAQLPESLQLQADIEDNLKIRGDKDKIKQAFLNVLVNSIQALSGVASPTIKVRIRKVNQIVDLSVSDNGCGMTEAVKSRMFEPFMTTKPKGTGLGLAMTHKIIQMHNAQIFVDSEVGRGTEIHVHFPLLEN